MMADNPYRFRLAPPPPVRSRRGLPPGSGMVVFILLVLAAAVWLVSSFFQLDQQLQTLEADLVTINLETEKLDKEITRMSVAAMMDRPLSPPGLTAGDTAEVTGLALAPVEPRRIARYHEAADAAISAEFLRTLGGDRLLKGVKQLPPLVSGEVELVGGELTWSGLAGGELSLRLAAKTWPQLQTLLACLEDDPRFGRPAVRSLAPWSEERLLLELAVYLHPSQEGW